MQRKIVLSTAFFPPIWYLAIYARANTILIEQYENYQKRSYRNRAFIQSDKGPIMISVPLQAGKNNQCPVTQVLLATDNDWQHTIKQKLMSCYQHAPFYAHYEDVLNNMIQIYVKSESLFVANEKVLELLLHQFNMQKRHEHTRQYNHQLGDAITDLRNMPIQKWADNQYYYPQVFEHKLGFQSGLSCIDLLLEKGPESLDYLRQLNITPDDAE